MHVDVTFSFAPPHLLSLDSWPSDFLCLKRDVSSLFKDPQCRSLLAPFARVPRSLESKTHILKKEERVDFLCFVTIL